MSERWEWACPECGHVNVVAEVIDAVLWCERCDIGFDWVDIVVTPVGDAVPWCERCVVPPASDEDEEG